MSTTEAAVSSADVVVAVDPARAFEAFTAEIDNWWKKDSPFWMDKDRRLGLRFEPRVGGRFIEVYDAATGEGYEIGRVTAWEPGSKVAYTWRQSDWPEDAITDVEVTFEPVDGGTRVRIRQTGWERFPGGVQIAKGYSEGASTLLAWFAAYAEGGST
jgi:uncharacterized protein YndB with AHSA1/START domain